MLYSQCLGSVHVTLMCPSSHDMYLVINTCVKEMSAWFLHCKVTIFFFINKKQFVGRYFETIPYFSLNFHLLILASTEESFLSQLLWWWLPNGEFSNSTIPSIFISWHSTIRQRFFHPLLFPSNKLLFLFI